MCSKLYLLPAITIDFQFFASTHVFLGLCFHSYTHCHMLVAVFSFLFGAALRFAYDDIDIFGSMLSSFLGNF